MPEDHHKNESLHIAVLHFQISAHTHTFSRPSKVDSGILSVSTEVGMSGEVSLPTKGPSAWAFKIENVCGSVADMITNLLVSSEVTFPSKERPHRQV